MASITVRNIPESVVEKLRFLSEIERRSLNNEILMAIESGLKELEHKASSQNVRVSAETQMALWSELAGRWKDSKPKKSQIQELYDNRTLGRTIVL